MINQDLLIVLDRELATCQAEIQAFSDQTQIWALLPGITNSAGNLALHVAGNLQHFIGAGLGSTGYVRDRAAEFGSRDLPGATVVAALEEAREMLAAVLPALSPETLAASYPDAPGGIALTTQRFLIHLATHAAFHAGQIGYLRRILTEESVSTGGVSFAVLAR